MPLAEKTSEPMPVNEEATAVEKAPESTLTAEEIWGPLAGTAKATIAVFEILLDSAK